MEEAAADLLALLRVQGTAEGQQGSGCAAAAKFCAHPVVNAVCRSTCALAATQTKSRRGARQVPGCNTLSFSRDRQTARSWLYISEVYQTGVRVTNTGGSGRVRRGLPGDAGAAAEACERTALGTSNCKRRCCCNAHAKALVIPKCTFSCVYKRAVIFSCK